MFLCFYAPEKDLSDVAFAAGKNKNRPKTFQTPENTILSLLETDSFDKIFMASWIVKLVANSLQTSTTAGVPNLGYMYPWGYICLSEGVHLRLAIEGKKIFTCCLF